MKHQWDISNLKERKKVTLITGILANGIFLMVTKNHKTLIPKSNFNQNCFYNLLFIINKHSLCKYSIWCACKHGFKFVE